MQFKPWLQNAPFLQAKKAKRSSRRSMQARFRPAVEILEDRRVLAIGYIPANSNDWSLNFDDGNQQLIVLRTASRTLVVQGDQDSPGTQWGPGLIGHFPYLSEAPRTNYPDSIAIQTNSHTGSLEVYLNGEIWVFAAGEVETIDIFPGGGVNSVIIHSTNVFTRIRSESSDNISIGTHYNGVEGPVAPVGLKGIEQTVAILSVGEGYNRTLNINDSVNTLGRQFDVSQGGVHFGSTANILFEDCNVNVYGGSGGNTFLVRDTIAGHNTYLSSASSATANENIVKVRATSGPLRVDSKSSQNVFIGSEGKLAAVKGTVTVSSNGGSTSLIVDDKNNGAVSTNTLGTRGDSSEWGYISSPGHGEIKYANATTDKLTLYTGIAAGNVVSVWENRVPTNILSNAAATVNVGDGFVGVQDIRGTLTISNEPARTTINIDDSADLGARNAHMGTIPFGEPGWGYITGLSAYADIHYKYAETASLTINTSRVPGNIFGVWENRVPTSILANAAATVNVGNGLVGVQDIRSTLKISNQPSLTTINIDDTAGPGARNAHMWTGEPGWGYITGLSAYADIHYKYADTASLTINTSRVPGNIFGVWENRVPTNIFGNADATVRIGNGIDGLQSIFGVVTVKNPYAFTDLILDNRPDANAHSAVLISDFSITGLTPATAINYSWNRLSSLTVYGGNGNNTFDVSELGIAATLVGGAGFDKLVCTNDVNFNSGDTFLDRVVSNPFVTYPLGTVTLSGFESQTLTGGARANRFEVSGSTAYTLDGRDGGDTYLINLAGFQAPFVINDTGAVGANELVVNDADNNSFGSSTYELTSNSIRRTDAPFYIFFNLFQYVAKVTFSPMATVALNTGHAVEAPNAINVLSTASGAATTINTGDGVNQVNIQATGAGSTTTIRAGIGTDTIHVGDTDTNLDGIGNLSVLGNSNTGLTLNDQANADVTIFDESQTWFVQTCPSYLITSQSVTRSNTRKTLLQTSGSTPVEIASGTVVTSIQYDNVASLTIHGGSSANVFDVLSTASGTPLTLNGGSGTDVVTIGPNLDAIGRVSILGNAGFNTLKINDEQGTGVPPNLPAEATNVQTSLEYGVTGQDVTRTAGFGYALPNGGGGGVFLSTISYQGMATLELIGSNVGAEFNIIGTAVPTTIKGGSGDDDFTIGPNLDAIGRTTTILGNAGLNTLKINDEQGTGLPTNLPDNSANLQHSLSYSVTAALVSRASAFSYAIPGGGGGGSSYLEFSYQGIKLLELDSSDTNETIDVQSTALGTTTLVDTGRGNDVIQVGNNRVLSGINGPLHLQSATSSSGVDLFLDDYGELAPKTVVLDDGSVTGLAPATISWVPSAAGDGGITGVYVLGGRGGNVFTVNNTSLLYHYTYLIPGVGRNQVNVRGMQGNLYVSSVFGGVDAVTIGSQAPALGGTLASVNGDFYLQGGGTSTLVVDDRGTSADRTSTVTATGVQGLAPAALHWLPGVVKSVALNWGSGNDQIIVQGTAVGVTTTLNGGGGNDAFIRQDLLGSLAPLRLDGGGGVNALDYSAFVTQVTVNLLTGTATNAQGGIANFANLYGGAGDDILIGNDLDNALAGNGGNDLLLGLGDSDMLYGNAGRDILIGGLGADVLEGGTGDDLLIGGYTSYDTQEVSNGANSHAIDLPALDAIMQEWAQGDSPALSAQDNYKTRLSHLRGGGGLNGSSRLDNKTVFDDANLDMLLGGDGFDWFLLNKKQDGDDRVAPETETSI